MAYYTRSCFGLTLPPLRCTSALVAGGCRMKRSTSRRASLACFLLILVASVALAYKSTLDEEDSRSGSWLKLSEGVNVFRVSRPVAKGPEFAILRLTDDTYREFQKDHKTFVNKYHVFSKLVNNLPDCIGPSPEKQKPTSDDPEWYVMMPHWPESNARCVVYTGVDPSD